MKKISNKAFVVSVITVTAIAFTACKKSWLDPKPLSVYVPENTLIDIQGFKSALSSISNNLKQEWYGDASPNISEQIFSDESVEGTDDKTGPAQNLDQLIRPDAQLNHTDFNKIGYFWDRQYVSIRAANVVISRVQAPEAASIPDSAKNVILGQAYFFRAYSYYRLVHQFGDVPCPIKEVTSPKTDFFSVKREVILQRMKADLEFAVKWVPWVTDKGDINRAACYHQLAKINLALGLFDDAIANCTAVITQGSYKLVTTRFGVDAANASKNVTWDLHRPENKAAAGNTEVLYLVTDRFGTPGAFSGGSQIMRNATPFISVGAPNLVTPSGKAAVSASQGIEIDNMMLYGRGIGRCRSTPYYYREIWDDPNDERHDTTSGNWMNMENIRYSNPALKGTDTAYGLRLRLYGPTGTLLCRDTLRDWYPWPHYKTYVPDQINNPWRGGNGDWYVFRLAETYLLRAEAYMWKGDATSAAADVNAVRTRAKCAAYPASKMSIGTILDERARELYYEEPRKTELTRIAYIFAKTGQSYNGKTYTMANFSTSNFMVDRILEKNVFYAKNFTTVHGDQFHISQYHVLWPVPQAAILANTDGHINQNVGYTGASSNVPPLDKIPE